MKIYLSPSDQKENKYATGNTNEAEVCDKIADAAKDALIRNGYDVKKGSINTSYEQRVAESNDWGADVHHPIHTNAGGGDGTLVMCWTGYENNKYVVSVYNEVAALSPGKDDGIKVNTSLYEINGTVATCVYLEVEFHDNTELAEWIIGHTKEIGEAIAKGYCKADGKTYKASNSSGSSSTAIKYYVQCGAFSDKKNADALAEKLKKDGYDVYIKTS